MEFAPRLFALGISVAALAGAALAGTTLTREPIWNDEVASLALVSRSFPSMLSEFATTQSAGLLFHVAIWPIVQLGGVSTLWLRLPALLAFVASIVVCGLVGARLGGHFVGVCAALFLAVCPFAVLHAQDARMYAFALLFSLLAFWLLLRALERPSTGRWVAYALAVAAVGYSHEFALLIVIAHAPLVIADGRRASRGEFAASLGGAALLLGPLAVVSARNFGSDPLYYVTRPGLDEISDTVLAFAGSRPGAAVCILVIGAGAATAILRHRSQAAAEGTVAPAVWAALGLWLGAPFAILFVGSQVKPLLTARYVTPSAAAACLLLAIALALLRPPLAATGAVAVATLLAYGSVQSIRVVELPDWPAAAAWIEQRPASDDRRIVLLGGQRNAAALVYHARSFGVERDQLPWTEDELAQLPESLAIIDKDNDVADLRALLRAGPAWVVRQGHLQPEKDASFDRFLRSCETASRTEFRLISIELVISCGESAG